MKEKLIMLAAATLCSAGGVHAQSVYSLNLDPAFEAAVRKSLNLPPDQQILIPQIEAVTNLDFADQGLTNIILFPGLTSLATLNLQGNQLKDVILPEGLYSLALVDLRGNPLTKLQAPIGYDLTSVDIQGFAKSNVSFYIPTYVTRLPGESSFAFGWKRGMLQSKGSLDEPWTNVPGFYGEILVEPGDPQRFYRVVEY